ncbi:m-AAA protease-interacting protein 1, mitochondrial [Culicoides brevitarsis]|uniref:m-AAA protease-interacting protein 1, mitochondrial n=1 Tax=Culicoides brevitarsis TaxID=469753 RepID=UPI00307BA89E
MSHFAKTKTMIISSKISRPYLLRNLRCFSAISSSNGNHKNSDLRANSALQSCLSQCSNFGQFSCGNVSRLFSTSARNCQVIPPLMEFDKVLWPSVIQTVKNFFLVNLIIRPYFDNDFDIGEFVEGSKQALCIISSTLASGTDLDSLRGLVTQDALNEIKNSVSRMSVAQRNKLAVDKEDIYFCFPYQVGIMFDETDSVQKRWVEITMVYHVHRGVAELKARGEPITLNLASKPEMEEKFSVCNYRFIKEFTKDQHSDWVVNIANHFCPSDK